jgi:hypothetical protein
MACKGSSCVASLALSLPFAPPHLSRWLEPQGDCRGCILASEVMLVVAWS